MNYLNKLLKALPVVFVIGLAPIYAQNQTCEEELEEAKKAHREKIETEFADCDDDGECLNKVVQNAKKHPYLEQYRECKRATRSG